MRFIKAYIDGYGKFHNLDFIFEPGFNLFFGPNEAGKTTMMSFLRAIFFGCFPSSPECVGLQLYNSFQDMSLIKTCSNETLF